MLSVPFSYFVVHTDLQDSVKSYNSSKGTNQNVLHVNVSAQLLVYLNRTSTSKNERIRTLLLHKIYLTNINNRDSKWPESKNYWLSLCWHILRLSLFLAVFLVPSVFLPSFVTNKYFKCLQYTHTHSCSLLKLESLSGHQKYSNLYPVGTQQVLRSQSGHTKNISP